MGGCQPNDLVRWMLVGYSQYVCSLSYLPTVCVPPEGANLWPLTEYERHDDKRALSFNANVSRGVEHLAEADIETIRDLLRGYGSHRSIIKELIQNAEDAGATRLDFIYLPADQSSGNTLARTPGLLVVNDGPFTDEHRRAIFRINLGTKGTDDRAIGRFGKRDSRAFLPGARLSS